MQNRIYILFLLSFVIIATSCSKLSKIQKRGDVEEMYEAATNYYNDEDYYRASLLFEDLMPAVNGTEKSEASNYYFAFCQYKERQLLLAAFYFQRFYQTFPRSEFAEECTFMYALSLSESTPKPNLDQTNTYEAINAFQSFVNKYPKSALLDSANNEIDRLQEKLATKAYANAKLYLKIEKYKSAVIAFNNFALNFPDSEYNEEIAFLKIKAQQLYAKASIESGVKEGKIVYPQLERYEEVVHIYHEFIDTYPSSEYLKEAESIKEASEIKVKELETKKL